MQRLFGTATIAVTLMLAASAAAAPDTNQTNATQVPVADTTKPSDESRFAADVGIVPNKSTESAETATDSADQKMTAEKNSSEKAAADADQPASLAALVESHRNTTIDDAEGKCLAAAVYFESKGEPLNGQLAVAEVLMNRTHSGRFPETLCGVVKQPSQFSFVHHGQIPSISTGSKEWRTAQAITTIARKKLWHPMVGGAMFFHAKRVSPHWHAVQVASLGHHIFYR